MNPERNTLQLRRYRAADADELWNLFFHTIRTVNIADYTLEQVQAWAPDDIDPKWWRLRMLEIQPILCVRDDVVVGYAGLRQTGYVDHFYVHHQWQHRGVGKRLITEIQSNARKQQIQELTADVCITAKPFFESQGFEVVTPAQVTLRGVTLDNYKMRKGLNATK